jgi:hypothetical protein
MDRELLVIALQFLFRPRPGIDSAGWSMEEDESFRVPMGLEAIHRLALARTGPDRSRLREAQDGQDGQAYEVNRLDSNAILGSRPELEASPDQRLRARPVIFRPQAGIWLN